MADQAVARITAGASGIGLTCARALSAEGHAVLTMDIDATAVAAFQAEFGEQTAVVCDVSDADQVVAAWGQLIESRGRIDVLINNAGIAGPQQPVEEIDVASWQQTINTDLNSAFYVYQYYSKLIVFESFYYVDLIQTYLLLLYVLYLKTF